MLGQRVCESSLRLGYRCTYKYASVAVWSKVDRNSQVVSAGVSREADSWTSIYEPDLDSVFRLTRSLISSFEETDGIIAALMASFLFYLQKQNYHLKETELRGDEARIGRLNWNVCLLFYRMSSLSMSRLVDLGLSKGFWLNPPASSKIWGPELTSVEYNCLAEKFAILLTQSSGIEIRSGRY